MAEKKLELFTEILASDRLGTFQNLGAAMANVIGADDPTLLWEQIKWNPWVAQAIFEDMSDLFFMMINRFNQIHKLLVSQISLYVIYL